LTWALCKSGISSLFSSITLPLFREIDWDLSNAFLSLMSGLSLHLIGCCLRPSIAIFVLEVPVSDFSATSGFLSTTISFWEDALPKNPNIDFFSGSSFLISAWAFTWACSFVPEDMNRPKKLVALSFGSSFTFCTTFCVLTSVFPTDICLLFCSLSFISRNSSCCLISFLTLNPLYADCIFIVAAATSAAFKSGSSSPDSFNSFLVLKPLYADCILIVASWTWAQFKSGSTSLCFFTICLVLNPL